MRDSKIKRIVFALFLLFIMSSLSIANNADLLLYGYNSYDESRGYMLAYYTIKKEESISISLTDEGIYDWYYPEYFIEGNTRELLFFRNVFFEERKPYVVIHASDSPGIAKKVAISGPFWFSDNNMMWVEADAFYSAPNDGSYWYFSGIPKRDIHIYENSRYKRETEVNTEVWLKHQYKAVYRFEVESEAWERLTYNYSCYDPIVSNDGGYLIYTRNVPSEDDEGNDLVEQVYCFSNGYHKAEFTRDMNLEYSNDFLDEIQASIHGYLVRPSLSRIYVEGAYDIVHYYATPFLEPKDKTPGPGNKWIVIKFTWPNDNIDTTPDDYKGYIIDYSDPEEDFPIWYDVRAEVIDLGIPFTDSDYIIDIRFSSDGNLASIVGVKGGGRKAYIFDIETKELTKIEGSEGVITTRWLNVNK